MKKCPFCAEEIQDEAKKCRFCDEFLEKPAKAKWCFKLSFLIVSFLCIGPFMLPLVWLKPDWDRKVKSAVTIIVLIVSYFLALWFSQSLKTISDYYNMIS